MWLFRLVPILFMLPPDCVFLFLCGTQSAVLACGGGSNLEKTAGAGFGGAALFVLHEYLEFGLYYSIALLCCFCGAGPIRAGAEPASPNKESLAPAVSLWFYGAADCGPSVWVWVLQYTACGSSALYNCNAKKHPGRRLHASFSL